MSPGPGRFLRRLASLLIRGPHAPYVLGDLDEGIRRDVARGMHPWQARLRYVGNALRSAASLARQRIPGRLRRVPTLGASLLDVKLALRMLAKHPGLALVGTLAMALAIALATAWLEAVNDLHHPELPLEGGSRIVGIRNQDVAASEPELRSLHDFTRWRETLESIRDLSAFRSIERNLVVEEGRGEPLSGAEISASAFRVTRVPARLGRTLVEADEEDGAPRVVVLGYDVWRTRFHADAELVGRTVRLGDEPYLVVGVMPEGFGFPVHHQFWTSLKTHQLLVQAPEPRTGPSVQVFGRLVPGVALDEAQAELTGLARRTAAELPATHEHLRPRVVPYVELFGAGGGGGLYVGESIFVLLLVLLSANVATLVFARNASRHGEIAIRRALGASRGRIVVQLFVEALVLASLAALLALAGVRWAVEEALGLWWLGVGGSPPFWWDEGLAPSTVLWAGGLTVVAAVIVGVGPALRATGGTVKDGLTAAAGGGSTLRLGGLWTAVLVVQVAFSVAILPTALVSVRTWIRTETAGLGFPAEEFLAGRLEMDRGHPRGTPFPTAASLARFWANLEELERRLEAEPGVLGVTVADRFPGMDHPRRRVQVEGVAASSPAVEPGRSDGPAANPPEVRAAFVGEGFFEVLGVPLVSGRVFRSAELEDAAPPVIVNQAFVRQILGSRNAVGRRVRYVEPPGGEEQGPWYEIVGVAGDVATHRQGLNPGMPPAIYHPLAPGTLDAGDAWSVRMAVHVQGDPEAFAPRLREVTTALDPDLRLHEVARLDQPPPRTRYVQMINGLIVGAVALLALVALLISASGTYALMSFTVSRRTREIGIRTALGAGPHRIVCDVFARAGRRLAAGVVAGILLFGLQVVALRQAADGAEAHEQVAGGPWFLLAVAGAMTLVGLLACGLPTRRALLIEPTEALKQE